MKHFLFTISLLFSCLYSYAQDVWVDGYYRTNGTYVDGHYRTPPNSTVDDNYSTIGNTNPYTGKQGTLPRGGGVQYTPATTYKTNPLSGLHYVPSQPVTSSISYEDRVALQELGERYTKKKPERAFRGGKYFFNNNGTKNYVVKTLSR